MKGTKQKRRIAFVATVLVIATVICALCLCFIDNRHYVIDDYNLKHSKDADALEITIAHLSDLHFPKIKVDTTAMLQDIAKRNVDFVAITGDIVHGDVGVYECGVIEFVKQLIKIAPVYYVNGNHEADYFQERLLYKELQQQGVTVLENDSRYFSKGGKQITIVGITDANTYSAYCLGEQTNKDNYKVLLAHRPELKKSSSYVSVPGGEYSCAAPNLVLSGHAHGGQFRVFGKGLYAPSQGFFPKYDSGLYDIGANTKMIVSRGIGNSAFPFRFNNKPNIPIIKIYI